MNFNKFRLFICKTHTVREILVFFLQKLNQVIYFYTCDKQVLWESAGAFFPRDNSLVSARKSHSLGVRGLSFQPRGFVFEPVSMRNFFYKYSEAEDSHFFGNMRLLSFFGFVRLFVRKVFNVLKGSSLQFVLIFCNRTNVKKSQRVPSLRFFSTMRLLKILIFVFFSKIFQRLQRFPFIFLKYCNRMLVKKSQRAPFTVFDIVRNFKMNNFCLKIRFSEAQHAISEFCFFFRTGVFSMLLF